jgi:hydrogenase-1 operon protein HyaF
MSGLNEIGVKVITPAVSGHSGNALAILHEVTEALVRLADSGETALIDLQGLPLTPEDYELLCESMADGEVHARIDAIGPTEVRETRYPGVWWITHYNTEGDIVADMLEVCHVPEVLKSHPDDVRDAVPRLRQMLLERGAGQAP